jgi:hypothetical protein
MPEVSNPEMRHQLDHMLDSGYWARAGAQVRLLKYLVDKALKGVDAAKREVAADVFGQPDWQEEQQSKMGVTLLRLRKSLAKYYAGRGKSDPVDISIIAIERKIVAKAEYRATAPLIMPAHHGSMATTVSQAVEEFYASRDDTALACVVSGKTEEVEWHYLDGDPHNASFGNLIPLCRDLISHLQALRDGQRRTNLPALDPERLGGKLAAKHFRNWNIARAYGCAALAFHMGERPYGEEPTGVRVLRLCDMIHYARHHFSEPLMRHVIQQVALPFLSRIEVLDPIPALRLSLQFTALLEEAGYYADAEVSLGLASKFAGDASPSSLERGSLNAFILVRRRAQLLAERAPNKVDFDRLLREAQEHAGNDANRILTLNVVQVHRWLRQGSPNALKSALELLGPLISNYRRELFRDGELVLPQGLGAADFSEIFLLAAITACRVRPGDWNRFSQETVGLSQMLMNRSGHNLPIEYGSFIMKATDWNNAKATHMLRVAAKQVRKQLRPDAQRNITSILKCLTRVHVLESGRETVPSRSGPDL